MDGFSCGRHNLGLRCGSEQDAYEGGQPSDGPDCTS
jgi:hypothetical protein